MIQKAKIFYAKYIYLFNILGVIVTIVLTLMLERGCARYDKWTEIDQQTQILVNVIILADKGNDVAPPPYSASRSDKISFVKEAQKKVHTSEWASLSNQIPIISENSEIRDWQDALVGHKSIEQKTHPGEIASLELRAKYLALNQSYKGLPEVEIPSPIISYSGVAERRTSCADCATASLVSAVKLPEAAKFADMKMKGFVIDKLPKGWNFTSMPILDLSNPEVMKQFQKSGLNVNYKGRYFVPNYNELVKIESLGGEVQLFEAKGN